MRNLENLLQDRGINYGWVMVLVVARGWAAAWQSANAAGRGAAA